MVNATDSQRTCAVLAGLLALIVVPLGCGSLKSGHTGGTGGHPGTGGVTIGGGGGAGLGGYQANGGITSAGGSGTGGAGSGGAVTTGGTGGTSPGGSGDAGRGGAGGGNDAPADGAVQAGGESGKGGATSTGGLSGTGGAMSAGGGSGTGGAMSTGGVSGKGGTTSTGGVSGKGGATSTGGTGGSTTDCTGCGCQYADHPGTITIRSIGTSPDPLYDCPNNAKHVIFDFIPDDPAAASSQDRNNRFFIGSGQNPPASCLQPNGIVVGAELPAIRKNIISGSCSPLVWQVTLPDFQLCYDECYGP